MNEIELELEKLNKARKLIDYLYKDLEGDFCDGVNFIEKYCHKVKKIQEVLKK